MGSKCFKEERSPPKGELFQCVCYFLWENFQTSTFSDKGIEQIWKMRLFEIKNTLVCKLRFRIIFHGIFVECYTPCVKDVYWKASFVWTWAFTGHHWVLPKQKMDFNRRHQKKICFKIIKITDGISVKLGWSNSCVYVYCCSLIC